MYIINFIWRLLATGLCFVIFGIGGLFLSLVIFPLMRLVYHQKDQRICWSRICVQRCFKYFILLLKYLKVYEFNLNETDKFLNNLKGKIIVANHPTLIDVVILTAMIPNANCIVKKSMWDNFFIKNVILSTNYIKNSENVTDMIKKCNDSLNQGDCIVIFPEGTRTVPNRDLKLKRGAANIALRCNGDLVPVIINCKPATLTKAAPWYKIPETKAVFDINLAEIISIKPYIQKNKSVPLAARELTMQLTEILSKDVLQNA